MPITLNGDTGIQTPMYNGTITANAVTPSVNMKNRIINGAMVIDQRNAGASVTPANNAYTLDRWKFGLTQASKLTAQQNAGSVTPPAGFTNYLGITSSSAYSVGSGDTFFLDQIIEGFNTADLNWGTASAKTVTLSFWVRSSGLTYPATFGGAFRNSAANRAYPFSYTISAANTWEYKTITVAGDTSGTWVGATNGTGIELVWDLGSGSTYLATAGTWASGNYIGATGDSSVVGTNGATFYITGVQLEVGSTATSFDYRPYTTELQLAQRYYFKIKPASQSTLIPAGFNSNTTLFSGFVQFPVTMRIASTTLEQSGTATDYQIVNASGATNCSSVPTLNDTTVDLARTSFTVASGLTAGHGGAVRSGTSNGFLAWSAEL